MNTSNYGECQENPPGVPWLVFLILGCPEEEALCLAGLMRSQPTVAMTTAPLTSWHCWAPRLKLFPAFARAVWPTLAPEQQVLDIENQVLTEYAFWSMRLAVMECSKVYFHEGPHSSRSMYFIDVYWRFNGLKETERCFILILEDSLVLISLQGVGTIWTERKPQRQEEKHLPVSFNIPVDSTRS